jgi:riboflavin synthase
MFTGLVEEVGVVEEAKFSGTGNRLNSLRLTVRAPLAAKDTVLGDSIAVNGCCLTVVDKNGELLTFEAGEETLSRTTFSRVQRESRVNVERSVKVGDKLGGHLVTGHIDGQGLLFKRRDESEWSHFAIRASSQLMRQMAAKGSITVDGVSLTLVEVESERFTVALIPYTLSHTTLGQMQVGDAVNLETDLLAKYVERQLEWRTQLP